MHHELALLALYAEAIRCHGDLAVDALVVDADIAGPLQQLTYQQVSFAREGLGSAPVFGIRRSAALIAALETAGEVGNEQIMLAARSRLAGFSR